MDTPRLFPVRVKDRYGYLDAQGNLRIAPRWDVAGPFREGLARVGSDGASPAGGGRWGYIDEDGDYVIAPRFARAGDFSEGRAAVNEGGRYHYLERDDSWCFTGGQSGYIDRTGRVAGDLRWLGAEPFGEGVGAVYGEGGAYFVGRNGARLSWGPFSGTSAFSEGLAACARITPRGGLYGWIDTTGRFVIEPQFAIAGSFSAGLAPALQVKDYTYVFVDRRGEVAVQPADPCVFVLPYSHGLAAAMLAARKGRRAMPGPAGGHGFLDLHGHWAVPPQLEYAGSFRDGMALVQQHGRYGFMDVQGALRVPCELEWATEFTDGVALGLRDGRHAAWRADGSLLWQE